jgi:hypothetical protein
MKRLSVVIFALLFAFSEVPSARAQDGGSLEGRLGATLDTAMKIVAKRTLEFNTRIAEMNKAKPLEVASFDSAHLATNVSATLQFLDFLKKYRDDGNRVLSAFEDSMFVIAADFPPVKERDKVMDFAQAFKADQQAFDAHLSGMSQLYGDVLNVLLFMQRTKFTLNGTKLNFAAKNDVAEYQKLMAKIDETQKELQKTGAASRKATANANARLQALNDAANEAAGGKPAKKKKK